MSPKLKEFLQAWLDWVDAHAPDGHPFARSKGLCYNLMDFLKHEDDMYIFYDELMKLFRTSFGMEARHKKDHSPVWIYPFGGSHQYDKEYRNRTMHTNKERIAWVRNILEEK